VENDTKVKVNDSLSETLHMLTTKNSARNSHSEMRMQLFVSGILLMGMLTWVC